MSLPRLHIIRQRFPTERLANPAQTLAEQLAASAPRVPCGARVAVAVGSRGITHLAPLVAVVIRWVRAQGGVPFIVPAMGSHGGATAAGQRAVLAGYGVTEDAMDAPIRATMEVVELPRGDAETPVYCDRYAAEADAVILLNRIKPHTSFHGPYESGLLKMAAIGLGKQRQAEAIHALGVRGLREVMPQVGRQVLAHAKVLLGIAIVENARDETLRVEPIPAARIADREPELLRLAYRQLPQLPVDALDLLIVDEVGKNISGLGMDTNIIGRLKIAGQPEPERPRIRCILIRDLTADSHGNACGMGLADIMTRRVYDKIDLRATYANVLTTGFLERGKMPLIADTDRQAVEMALRALQVPDGAEARIARIRNTLQLDVLQVSAPVLSEVTVREDITVVGPADTRFDAAEALCPFAPV